MADILDKLLLQAIASNKEKIRDYQVKIAQFQTQVDILAKENNEFLQEYQKACKHTNTTTDFEYSEGGYDYKSTTTYKYKCVRCGTSLGQKVEVGYYA